mmetsp:Transcript_5113/g.8332  ORF Transcript_5113/g.8332 Transcript_5113/m.8332 type:complete len:1033 (+) Transcript_5113:163-3261(+)
MQDDLRPTPILPGALAGSESDDSTPVNKPAVQGSQQRSRGVTPLALNASPINSLENQSRSPLRLSLPKRFQWGAPQSMGSLESARSYYDRLITRSRLLCDSWRFNVLTAVLTVCALFGDDFRLAVTHKRTDVMFDVLTILCIIVFCTEIVASSLGKEEYFLGFFFMLDFLSTVTLFMDLSWISEVLFCSQMSDSSALRQSRAGRAGARAGRTVRIIRLIRLVKLYKTYRQAMEEKERLRRRASVDSRSPNPGEGEELQEDDEQDFGAATDDDEEEEGAKKPSKKSNAETRVGKKLSDMTTRRVIILVLVMLFAMPQFLPNSCSFLPSSFPREDFRSSASFGMEYVYERWRNWCSRNASSGTLPWCLQSDGLSSDTNWITSLSEKRWWYEHYLLNYIYAHYGDNFAWRLHWVGMNSTTLVDHLMSEGLDRDAAKAQAWSHLQLLSQLGQTRFLKDELLPQSSWDARFSNSNWQIPIKSLPSNIREQVAGVWSERCMNSDKNFVGISLASSLDGKDPTSCSIEEDLRCSEHEFFNPYTLTVEEELDVRLLFAFDIRRTTQLEAGLSMLQTVFICFAVGVGAMTFSNDANQLLLNPIERMIQKMETIKDNPLEAMRLGDFEWRREEMEAAKRKEAFARKSKFQKLLFRANYLKKVKEPMETVILEKTIIKLGGLLALGFGEAGAEIIGQNMQGGHSAGVNAMVPGQKVDAIIGFCNIRHFTDATEVLKEKVMLFVNRIGEIVHGCVDDYHGAPNKNIGDAFLLVWRLSGVSLERQTKLADMAIMSFIRIIEAINKSPVLADYRGHPGMLQRVPCYRVQMGFGLHCGWAIEGAIGSEFKIDASYLSPNVSIAVQVEQATSIYDVPILITEQVVQLSSEKIADKFRKIDQVIIKGSADSTCLYCLDLDYLCLKVDTDTSSRPATWNSRFRFKARQFLEAEKKRDFEVPTIVMFEKCTDIMHMSRRYTTEFGQIFNMGFQNYLQGEWQVAEKFLSRSQHMLHFEDGPSSALLEFMRDYSFQAPSSWRGVHDLLPPSVS